MQELANTRLQESLWTCVVQSRGAEVGHAGIERMLHDLVTTGHSWAVGGKDASTHWARLDQGVYGAT